MIPDHSQLARHETLELHELAASQSHSLMKLKKVYPDITDPILKRYTDPFLQWKGTQSLASFKLCIVFEAHSRRKLRFPHIIGAVSLDFLALLANLATLLANSALLLANLTTLLANFGLLLASFRLCILIEKHSPAVEWGSHCTNQPNHGSFPLILLLML
ncbi:hypothetical protein [Peribacillus muralis]|uniref:hypothetical protein n=1 Tax=Peribacillus muralis TaxID=264697 RepID=UPI003D04D42C